jgi:hypothetical protein
LVFFPTTFLWRTLPWGVAVVVAAMFGNRPGWEDRLYDLWSVSVSSEVVFFGQDHGKVFGREYVNKRAKDSKGKFVCACNVRSQRPWASN